MSAADASFPPDSPRLNLPSAVEDSRTQLERVVAQLNDYEDHDLTFPGLVSPETLAVAHGLRRVPSSFEILWIDNDANVYADTASGWGYNVVYFQSNAAARIRIRLR